MDDILKLQKYIDESNNIVFFGGAGVSTESGIKDFRGKNGLYKKKLYLNLPPEYMLSNKCLSNQPDLFFEYYKDNMNCLESLPNITHKYLKKLEETGKLKTVITQNIDGLHQKAGSSNVIELHGSIYRAYCNKCLKKYDGKIIFNSKDIPKCKCGGIIRPDIVLYGEMLNDSYNKAINYIINSDLLIVAGTSLTVEPACSLVKFFKGKLVIINETTTPYDKYANLVIHDSLGKVFSSLKKEGIK